MLTSCLQLYPFLKVTRPSLQIMLPDKYGKPSHKLKYSVTLSNCQFEITAVQGHTHFKFISLKYDMDVQQNGWNAAGLAAVSYD